jgi:hypothetical protein
MKKIKLIFAAVFCFVTICFGMEEKKYNYDGMINKLLAIPKKNLAQRIDAIAPEIRNELLDALNVKKEGIKKRIEAGRQECGTLILNELNYLSTAIEESLEEKSEEKSINRTHYNQNDLIQILDGIIETDRSEVYEKVKTFNQGLKEALINLIENYENRLKSLSNKPEVMRLLSKLDFIKEALNK